LIFLNKVIKKKIKVGPFKKKSTRSHEPIPRAKASVLAHLKFFFCLDAWTVRHLSNQYFFLQTTAYCPSSGTTYDLLLVSPCFGLLKNWGWDFSTLKIYKYL
jgi:hypothetical protein